MVPGKVDQDLTTYTLYFSRISSGTIKHLQSDVIPAHSDNNGFDKRGGREKRVSNLLKPFFGPSFHGRQIKVKCDTSSLPCHSFCNFVAKNKRNKKSFINICFSLSLTRGRSNL